MVFGGFGGGLLDDDLGNHLFGDFLADKKRLEEGGLGGKERKGTWGFLVWGRGGLHLGRKLDGGDGFLWMWLNGSDGL